ncbi:MAG: 3'(2'),5'-bisphosphate nucleotidase CysQ [Bdellovibrionales bacterium]|nr:3'(2'),5'-bisphosphate nucleotidase CysQ [Bdellovibrionales bacterium]
MSYDSFSLELAKKLALQAGEVILEIYLRNDPRVEHKADNSPLTDADLAANEIIVKGLSSESKCPVVTEESQVAWEIRKNWKRFWLVDPLDGTKDFLARVGGFTVNIALIENNSPILGVVYAPKEELLYWAHSGEGAFCNDKLIVNTSKRTDLIAADSVFHSTKATQDFLAKHGISKVVKFGSALKICKLAEGEVDLYPRLNGTCEWDTAAAHIIALEANCKLIDIKTNQNLSYNKKTFLNNHFIASRNDLDFMR